MFVDFEVKMQIIDSKFYRNFKFLYGDKNVE